MIVIEITPGPRFVTIVSRTDAGVYVAGVALPIMVGRQFTISDILAERRRRQRTRHLIEESELPF